MNCLVWQSPGLLSPLMNVFVCDRLQQEREEDSGSDEEFDGGLVVPGKIWKKLYK